MYELAYIPSGDQAARWSEMTDPILYERLAKLEATVTDLKAQMEVMQHAIDQLEAQCKRQKPLERQKAPNEKGWPRR